MTGRLLNRAISLLIAICLAALPCCGRNRAELRARRLESFTSALPHDVRLAFEAIESETDFAPVGRLLHEARLASTEVDARMDSIMRAELIPLFSDTEVVEYFWVYFDHALETGTVPDP
ncbi:hypothetical protein JW921_09655 [Candidatus Fermentibacterales bacterium]|nr:hypothetical protein [Candidatus Fermentibacterales bacterium]